MSDRRDPARDAISDEAPEKRDDRAHEIARDELSVPAGDEHSSPAREASRVEPTDRADDLNALPFEEAFSRLESVVRRLEGGEVTLDESLRLFEEGVGLARICAAKLDAAEGKMRVLLSRDDGELEEIGFDELAGALSS